MLSMLILRLCNFLQGNDGNRPQANQEPRNEVERLPQGAEGPRAIMRPGIENHITESAQRLMGAMRELLNSMTYRYENFCV